MQSPANKVVEARVDGKGAVASLMGQDPDASADKTLGPAVDHPGRVASNGVLNGRDEGDGEVDKRRSENQVASDVAEGAGGRGDKAVLGDGIANRLDVGELDLLGLAGSNLRKQTDMSVFFILFSFSLRFCCVCCCCCCCYCYCYSQPPSRHLAWTLKVFFSVPFPFWRWWCLAGGCLGEQVW